jgi:Integrase core domain/Bacterial regulatory proteins, luxR family
VTDPDTGVIKPVAIATDNGPCFKSSKFAAFIDRHPELIHIRTRRKSSGQNGVRERAFGSLKYEHLYRHEIDDGHDLGLHAEAYRQLFNTIRPHQTLGGRGSRPRKVCWMVPASWTEIAAGLSNTEIAAALVVSAATVKTHINHIFQKTGARDRAKPSATPICPASRKWQAPGLTDDF